jgi:hypothetical protein
MKKLTLLLGILFLTNLLISQTVYVTKTGKKYHSEGCSYLSKSKISMSLSDAKSSGYTACSRCSPPTTVEKKKETVKEPEKKQSEIKEPSNPTKTDTKTSPAKTTSTQCTGITKSGKRCSRMTTDPSGKCYQHK